VKLEEVDWLKLAIDNNYQFLLESEQLGIQPNRPAIFFPSAVDRFLNENSDAKGIYWLSRKDNEKLINLILRKILEDDPYRTEKRLLYKFDGKNSV
jgi:hypothetical protein